MKMLNDIHFWEQLPPTDKMEFPRDNPRPCTLEFNTSGEVPIYIWLKGEATPRLLALVKGRETVRFAVPCAYSVMHKSADVEVWILTRDGKTEHRVAIDEEQFTTLHEDMPKDPHMQAIEDKMFRRMARRQNELDKEVARMRAIADKMEARENGRRTESEAGSSEGRNADEIDASGGKQVANEGGADDNAPVADGAPSDVSDDGAK